MCPASSDARPPDSCWIDELCDRSRHDYLFAHTLIGRNFTSPVIRACLV